MGLNLKFNCPLCSSSNGRLLYNSGNYYLIFCQKCRSNYQIRYKELKKEYGKDYYFDNHAKTYGKTYIEDEENIRLIARRRLKRLKRIFPEKALLLDVGSAIGLFCDEARQAGFDVYGLEISDYAREYCIKRFGISCFKSWAEVEKYKYDVITLWFTLEHIEKPAELLCRINPLLKERGILALSLPNGHGAFARLNRKEYYKKRPEEHFFEPSINGMRILLKKAGFRLINVNICGLHPERIGLPDNFVIRGIQKILSLGDTFEVIAVKENK